MVRRDRRKEKERTALEAVLRDRLDADYLRMRARWDDGYILQDLRTRAGQMYEKEGKVEEAIPLYERNVAERFDGTHPFDRLRIIYTRQKRFADAIQVCKAYLALPDRPHGQDKAHFQHHRDTLRTRLERLQEKG